MKRKLLFSRQLLLIILTFLFSSSAFGQNRTLVNEQESLKLKSILSAESKRGWHRFTKGVVFDLQKPEQFFDQNSEAFELQKGYGMTLLKKTEEQELRMTHFRFQQTFNGVPIEGAVYILHHRMESQGDQLKGNGRIIRNFNKSKAPAISSQAALQSVLAQVNATKYAWESPQHEAIIKNQKKDAQATLYPQPKLVYYSNDVNSEDPSTYQLAYEMKVFALEPMSHKQYYVSADNGNLIGTVELMTDADKPVVGTTLYNGAQSITEQLTNTNAILRESNRAGTGTAISTYNMNGGTDYSLASNYVNSLTANTWTTDPIGVQGHWSAEKTFDYYLNTHGRVSIDNNGSEIILYLQYSTNYNNAFWNGLYATFGGGDNINRTSWASLDVVGHELTHGVTQHSADLVYANESGALNESFSDIFGNVVQFNVTGVDEWLVSEDVTVNKSGIRSMANPKAFSDPDTYLGTFWRLPNSGDNGGVHTNSGVQNHWFYLLAAGGSGTNDFNNSFTVNGIGRARAAAITYRSLTHYLTPNSQYRDAREGSLQAAEDLEGRTSNAYAQVAAAWYAVGVGFPVQTAQDLGIGSVVVGGSLCNQVSIELVNLSTQQTIPAGASVDVIVKENGVTKATEQIVLSAALLPGGEVTKTLSQPILSHGKVDIQVQVNYQPDAEPRNNISTARMLKGIVTIGGQNPDFTSISEALAALSDQNVIVCGHLDFKLRNGQYNEEVRISNITVADSNHTITFESETGNPDDVTIYSTINLNSAFGTLNIEGTNSVRIKNMTIVRAAIPGANAITGVAIRAEVHDFLMEGNKVRCVGITSNRESLSFWPFGLAQNNITIRNNLFELGDIGIETVGDASLVDNILIENNRLTDHQAPINVQGINITIHGNRIISSKVTNTGVQIYLTGELRFEGNELNLSTTNSASFYGLNVLTASYAKVYSNIININAPGTFDGVFIGTTVPVAEFYQNTIRVERIGTGTGQVALIDYANNRTASAIWNNILYSSVTDVVGIKLKGQDILSNGNDFYLINGFIGMTNTTTKYQTLALWRSATGNDANSLTLQPFFVSSSDLRLLIPQPNLISTRPTILTTDIDGELRSATPNIGADEYYFTPHSLTATPGDASVVLNWIATNVPFAVNHNIYGRQAGSALVLVGTVPGGTTTFTHTGLINNTTYNYQVASVNFGGVEGPRSAIVSATPVGVPPAAPRGLVAKAGDNQATLNWTANTESDLASYKIYGGLAGSTAVLITTIAAPLTTFTHTGLVNGLTYVYQVSAVDVAGNESTTTGGISVTPSDMTPPAVPQGLNAVAGDRSITLTWTANTESDLSFYKIYGGPASSSPVFVVSISAKFTSATPGLLTNGTTYSYQISAVDVLGNESARSPLVSATPRDTTIPAIPSGLRAQAGSGQVKLDWTANSESDLAGYKIYNVNGGTAILISTVTSPATTFTNTGLTNGTTYNYKISAVDVSGNESAKSTTVSATPSDIPATPVGLVAFPGDTRVLLNWTPNKESDIASYRIYFTVTTSFSSTSKATLNAVGGNGGGPVLLATIPATNPTSFEHQDLSNGTTYNYTISAVNASGKESPQSEIVSATPTFSLPSARVSKETSVTDTPITDNISERKVNVSPNPSKGVILIQLPNADYSTITVRDMKGVLVRQSGYTQTSITLDLGNISTGLYIMEIQQGKNTGTIIKVVID